jgi:hypothetical protein
MFAKGTLHVAELLNRMQKRERQMYPSAAKSPEFRVFRAAPSTNDIPVGVGLPLVIELPKRLLSASRYLKQVSFHLNHVVRDAFSLSPQVNTGTLTHRYTCLDPIVYIRLHYCNTEIVHNLLQASQFTPMWFSKQPRDAGLLGSSDMAPCEPMPGDSLYPAYRTKLRSAATGIQVANAFRDLGRQKPSHANDGKCMFSAAASSSADVHVLQKSNFPFQRNLSVQICFQTQNSDVIHSALSKFRHSFELSRNFPYISVLGSQEKCTVDDMFELSASISASARNCIIIDQCSSEKTYKPVMVPDCLVPSSPFVGAPCSAVEFLFGNPKPDAENLPAGQPFVAGRLLDIYHSLYQEFLGSLYRDTVLICNLCNQLPPNELKMNYKSLCECLYRILNNPMLVKDIENALSSSSFQSLDHRNSKNGAGLVWSTKKQNIFWKGVFAGAIFFELNEIVIGCHENREGLLSMRWIDSLIRVVNHYEHIGDNNLWATPGYAILFAHEKSHLKGELDLHRFFFFILFLIVFSVLLSTECSSISSLRAA